MYSYVKELSFSLSLNINIESCYVSLSKPKIDNDDDDDSINHTITLMMYRTIFENEVECSYVKSLSFSISLNIESFYVSISLCLKISNDDDSLLLL